MVFRWVITIFLKYLYSLKIVRFIRFFDVMGCRPFPYILKNKCFYSFSKGIPVPPPIFAYPPPSASMIHPDQRSLAMSNRKLAQSAGAGLDASDNSDTESQGQTGIYRRKGHLNERAFSYSIRQEHRSRSHGSLASLQFNNPPDLKKEREIAQMMAGLDLNDDATIYRRTQPQQQMQIPTNGGTFGKHQRK